LPDSLIGQGIGRIEDYRFLTGAGNFTDDINLPGQAFACFVRSPHAHARIIDINKTAALATPGALAVLTGEDYAADGLGALAQYANPADHLDPSKPVFAPDKILHDPLPQPMPIASERVRYVGEIVALIVAETSNAAFDAAERLAIDYDPLPACIDALAAAAPDAPRIWDDENVCVAATNGDRAATQSAFARADHVVRLSAQNSRVGGIPLEPSAAIADYDAAQGVYTLRAPTQGVHRYQMAVAAALDVAPDRMRVITADVGGGFGVRSACNPEYAVLPWAARRVGRPVKWTATRTEAFLSDFQARAVHVDGALALDRDGRFLALEMDYLGDLGAYPISFAVLSNVLRMPGGAYLTPAIHVAIRGVFTNTIPVSVYRGAGRPEAVFIVERLIDLAAGEMGIDRAELRRLNLIPPEALPYDSPLGHCYDSGAFSENLESALDRVGWEGFGDRRAEAARRGRLAGIGVANYLESPSGAPHERADIRVLPQDKNDGEIVEAVIGTQASGQGHETSFAQVVAATLEIPLERVSIFFGDTDRVASGGGSHSDRSMRLGGTVLARAAGGVIEQGRVRAAQMLEAAEADIVYSEGRFNVTGTDRSVGLFEVASGDAPLAATSAVSERLFAHPNGVAACEVEIDPETGAVEITRYVTTDDVGRVINPVIVDGQVHGGIAQGVGQALMENFVYGAASGQLLSGSFMDYAMPRADTFPTFSVAINGLPAPSNPLGVKGAGECGTTPATAAVIGAVVDALRDYGVTHIEMPVTAERVRAAIIAASR